MDWEVVEARGGAGTLHAHLPDPSTRGVRVCVVDRPALVLGSAQHLVLDEERRAEGLGLEVAHRRSGGAAVQLAPGDQVWVDISLPRDDPLWIDDVSCAGWWLGEAFVLALGEGSVHRGGMVRTALSDRVCFAGVGPGEVTVGAAKLVGVSQRRSRAGAVFQCTVPLRWDPSPLVSVFALEGGALDSVGRATVLAHDAVVERILPTRRERSARGSRASAALESDEGLGEVGVGGGVRGRADARLQLRDG